MCVILKTIFKVQCGAGLLLHASADDFTAECFCSSVIRTSGRILSAYCKCEHVSRCGIPSFILRTRALHCDFSSPGGDCCVGTTTHLQSVSDWKHFGFVCCSGSKRLHLEGTCSECDLASLLGFFSVSLIGSGVHLYLVTAANGPSSFLIAQKLPIQRHTATQRPKKSFFFKD